MTKTADLQRCQSTGHRPEAPRRARSGLHIGRRAARPALAVLCVGAVLVAVGGQPSAGASTVRDTPAPVTGNATWFYALGGPYGGCGMPQAALETQNFVALNVYDLPGDYSTFHPRPIDPALADDMGIWDNGRNCGRWVRVSIGDYCTGDNDGAPNKPFCRNGSWVSDRYNGATLDMLVADSCGDGNAWCRDDPYHLDLAKDSLNTFVKDGVAVGDMDPDHWNNRQINWQFIQAPDYTGDIRIGFLQSAQPWWAAIAVSRLPNGLHGVEYLQQGVWQKATMNGDMGQSYIIGGTTPGGSQFKIRVRDVDDQLVNDGRVYSFTLPASCAPICDGAYTAAAYTTDSSDPSATPTAPQPTAPPTGTCTATYRTAQSWPGGFMGEVTVQAGDRPIGGWTVTMTLDSGQTIAAGDLWNGTMSTDGSVVTVTNGPYNANLAANASTTFGFIATGTPPPPTPLTCTPA